MPYNLTRSKHINTELVFFEIHTANKLQSLSHLRQYIHVYKNAVYVCMISRLNVADNIKSVLKVEFSGRYSNAFCKFAIPDVFSFDFESFIKVSLCRNNRERSCLLPTQILVGHGSRKWNSFDCKRKNADKLSKCGQMMNIIVVRCQHIFLNLQSNDSALVETFNYMGHTCWNNLSKMS